MIKKKELNGKAVERAPVIDFQCLIHLGVTHAIIDSSSGRTGNVLISNVVFEQVLDGFMESLEVTSDRVIISRMADQLNTIRCGGSDDKLGDVEKYVGDWLVMRKLIRSRSNGTALSEFAVSNEIEIAKRKIIEGVAKENKDK